MKISKRLGSVPMSGIRKMFDAARPDSINLGLGEPDLTPPEEAIEGMYQASRQGKNGYGPTAGISELRNRIGELHGVTGNNIMITPSGTSALFLAANSLLDPGDEALIPDPGFVVYGPHSVIAGAKVRTYGMTEGFVPDVNDIINNITGKTKVLFVNSPSNPTGGILDKRTFKALCDIASDNSITIISDEVYDRFIYEAKHISFAGELDDAIIVNGFSKTMAVTGWRIGYTIASEKMISELTKMNYHMCASPNMPVQYGILNALPSLDRYVENAKTVFKARRDLIFKRLSSIDGMSITLPKGAFYAFPRFDADMTSEELAIELAGNGLICTPGSAFGKSGEGHLRFSYAASEDKINSGMDILENVYGKMV